MMHNPCENYFVVYSVFHAGQDWIVVNHGMIESPNQ